MRPIEDWPSFAHTKQFGADWTELGLGDEGMARLQNALLAAPTAGGVTAGTGGFCKSRFPRPGE
jgi:hypothetical protein